MSYFDDASLVMIPSGYKTSKVYSVKPTDGSGDLTFTRSNDTATRVNSAGLIEKVRTNICLYSEQFDNAWWVKGAFVGGTAPTITSNYGEAPNGTTTADRVQFPSQSGSEVSSLQTPNSFAGVNFIGSIYVRTISGTCSNLVIRAGATESVVPSFSTTWTRITAIPSTNPADEGLQIRNRPSVSGDGSAIDILVWGAQLETGDIATDYIETTTAAVSVGPVANVPRLDYLGSSCPRLLLEPQRTNSAQYSENFDNGFWNKLASTATANNVISPSGYQDADTITADGTSAIHRVANASFIALGAGKTLSVFAKAGTNNFLQFYTDSTNNDFANFDLSNGVVGTKGSDATSSIEDYGNGWYRCIMTTGNAASSNFSMVIVNSASAARAQSNTLTTSVHLWGAQIEAGAYATSYIPTLGAAVTRGADAASKTGISSLIGQTEGTLFVEVDTAVLGDVFGGNNRRFLTISDGTTNNRIVIAQNRITDAINLAVIASATLVADISTASNQSGIKKIAVGYANNDFVMYVNGVQIGTDTSGSVPACSRVGVGSFETSANSANAACPVSQAILFPTRLSNSDLAALTA